MKIFFTKKKLVQLYTITHTNRRLTLYVHVTIHDRIFIFQIRITGNASKFTVIRVNTTTSFTRKTEDCTLVKKLVPLNLCKKMLKLFFSLTLMVRNLDQSKTYFNF